MFTHTDKSEPSNLSPEYWWYNSLTDLTPHTLTPARASAHAGWKIGITSAPKHKPERPRMRSYRRNLILSFFLEWYTPLFFFKYLLLTSVQSGLSCRPPTMFSSHYEMSWLWGGCFGFPVIRMRGESFLSCAWLVLNRGSCQGRGWQE